MGEEEIKKVKEKKEVIKRERRRGKWRGKTKTSRREERKDEIAGDKFEKE